MFLGLNFSSAGLIGFFVILSDLNIPFNSAIYTFAQNHSFWHCRLLLSLVRTTTGAKQNPGITGVIAEY